jgi:predicted nucleic acid-binding protein
LSVLFDARALLIFYLGELGSEKGQVYLERIQRGRTVGYLNVVNLTELRYMLYRRDPELAEEKEKNLRALGLEIVPVLDDELWRTAAISRRNMHYRWRMLSRPPRRRSNEQGWLRAGTRSTSPLAFPWCG